MGTVTVLPDAVMHIEGDTNRNLRGGTIDNQGTLVWSGSATLTNTWGTTVINQQDARFEIRGAGTVTRSNSRFHLHNFGRIAKLEDEGTTRFASSFNSFQNHGIIEVQQGILRIDTGSNNQNTGDFLIADGSRVEYRSGTHRFDGSSFSGDGQLRIHGGSLNEAEVRPAGVLTITGEYVQTESGVLRIELGGLEPGSGHDQLVVSEGAELDGALQVFISEGFVPEAGAVFTVLEAGSVSGTYSDVERTGLPSNRTIVEHYEPDSVGLEVEAVVVSWTGGGDGTSWDDPANWSTDTVPGAEDDVVIDVAEATTVVYSSGTRTLNSLQSNAVLELTGGRLDIADTSQTEGLQHTGGTLGGTGTLTVTGAFVWTGGRHEDPGTTRVEGSFELAGSAAKTIERGRTVVNATADGIWSGEGDFSMDSSDAAVTIGIGGTEAGDQYDRLVVTGTADLRGTLNLELRDGFRPSRTDTFSILTADGVSGTFSEVVVPEGFEVEVTYGPTEVSVQLLAEVQAEQVRAELLAGLEELLAAVPSWGSLFDLDVWPDSEWTLPAVTDRLAELFLVETVLSGLAPPEVAEAETMEALVAALEEAGLQVLAALDGAGDVPATEEDHLRVRLHQQIDVAATGLFDPATAELLEDLGPGANLQGVLETTGTLAVDLTFGVGDEGFFIEPDSELALSIFGQGNVSGGFGLGNALAVDADGSVVLDEQTGLEVRLSATGDERFAPDVLPETVLVPQIDGAADVVLQFALQPLGMDWSGSWSLAVSDNELQATGQVLFPTQDDLIFHLLPLVTEQFGKFFGPEVLGSRSMTLTPAGRS